MNKRFTKLIAALALLVFMTPSLTGWGQTRETLTFDFEDESAHRTEGSNSYTSNTYSENGVDITLTYADAVTTGTPLNGSANVLGRVAKNTTNSPVVLVGPVVISNQTITEIKYDVKGVAAMSQVVEYSTDNENWTTLLTLAALPTSKTTETISNLNIIGANLYLKWTTSVSNSTSSNRDFQLDDIHITYTASGGIPTVSTPVISPNVGSFIESQEVSINCATDGATIYYTTDGNDPTTSSDVYSASFTINETTTVKAMAVKEGMDNSVVASATFTFVNIEHAGTEADPYSVADARAAVDANVGTQGVYATGIVSAIPTAWNSQYNNITFNFVDNEGDTDFLQAYRCVSTDNADASTVAVGDVVVVYGDLTKYGSTYEFNSGCQLVSLTHPVITTPVVTVTPNTINAPADGVNGALTITYENITEIISFDYYFCDADGNELEDTDPDYPGDWIYAEINDENDAYTLDYIIDANQGEARTAYMKVYTFDDNEEEVFAIVTVNQAKYVVDYAELPFEYDGNGTGDLPNGFTVSGLGTYNSSPAMKFDGTGDYAILKFNERPGTLTFDIKGNSFSGGTFTVQTSENGETYTDFETYTELGSTQSESFDNLGENVRYIKWIYTVKSSGNVALGNIALAKYVEPVLVPSITVTPELVEVDATEHEGTLGLAYENLEISDMNDFIVVYFDNQGGSIDDPDWIEVSVAEQDSQIGEGYVVSYYMLENVGEARSAFFKVIAADGEDFVYSNLVTVNQAAYVAPVTGDKYVKVASADDLTDGQYLIVYEDGNLAFNGGLETLDAVDNSISVTISENEIGVTDATAAAEFTIDVTNGTLKSASGKYIGVSSNSNGLKQSDDASTYINSFSIDESGNAVIAAVFDQSNMTLRYNKASNQNRFRYYGSGQEAIQLYKKAEATPAGNQLSITGYGEGSGNWYLIASPVSTTPEAAGMITDELGAQATPEDATYDLYKYDQNAEDGLEWRNYRMQDFNLEPGTGYLYANKNDVTLTFTGTAYEGDGSFNLVPGWNLVGNPYGQTAYITNEYYVMNGEGSELVAGEGNAIDAMQGIFVNATEAGTMTFSTENNAKAVEQVVMNVTRNRGTAIDRAIVRFDEGQQLPKFQLNPNNTKLYIAQGNKDYAIVRSAAQGEMPISFRAAENGTYTLSIETENVEMDYLHLIDNMTGMDVDLLPLCKGGRGDSNNPQTASYTFEAKTSDYASRFRLVFSANSTNEQYAETFAFFNGSEWMVSNLGEATLQVVDVMGRVLSTETISGNAELSLNQPAGVYMLRLINGNDVKVQKVVVR